MEAEVVLDANCKRREMHRIAVNSAGANIFNRILETQKSTQNAKKGAEMCAKIASRFRVYHPCIKHDDHLRRVNLLLTLGTMAQLLWTPISSEVVEVNTLEADDLAHRQHGAEGTYFPLA